MPHRSIYRQSKSKRNLGSFSLMFLTHFIYGYTNNIIWRRKSLKSANSIAWKLLFLYLSWVAAINFILQMLMKSSQNIPSITQIYSKYCRMMKKKCVINYGLQSIFSSSLKGDEKMCPPYQYNVKCDAYPYHYQCHRYSSSPMVWNNRILPSLQCNHIDIRHFLMYTDHDVNNRSRNRLSIEKEKMLCVIRKGLKGWI